MRHEELSMYVEELKKDPTYENLEQLSRNAFMTPQALLREIENRPDFSEQIGNIMLANLQYRSKREKNEKQVGSSHKSERLGRAKKVFASRRQELECDFRNGMSIAEMSKKYGIGTSSVVTLRRKLRQTMCSVPSLESDDSKSVTYSGSTWVKDIIDEIGELDPAVPEIRKSSDAAGKQDMEWIGELNLFLSARNGKPREITVLYDGNKTNMKVMFDGERCNEVFEYTRIDKEV